MDEDGWTGLVWAHLAEPVSKLQLELLWPLLAQGSRRCVASLSCTAAAGQVRSIC